MVDERHARWEELPEHRRCTEPTLELLVRQISSGAPNTVSSFRLLKRCATFPALAHLHHEEPYCSWSLTGEDFQGVFTKGTVEEARTKSNFLSHISLQPCQKLLRCATRLYAPFAYIKVR